MIDEDVFVSYLSKGVIGEIRAKMRVLSEQYTENGVILKVRTTEDLLQKLKKKLP